ncbi:MAG: hypothetical protein P8Z70_09665 [Desulfuromonadales bacterium]
MSLPAGAERTASSSPECDDIIDELSLRGQSEPVRIRRFRQSDREAIRRICCDTGFLGAPIDAIYQDRELFADLLTDR